MILNWKDHLFRLSMTLMLSLGLLFPLIIGLNLPLNALSLLLMLLFSSALLELAFLDRKTILPGIIGIIVLLIIWFFPMGGQVRMQNIFRAVSLHFSGITFALPLIAEDFSGILSIGITFLCFLCARKSAGGVPALLLCITSLLMIWLSDRFSLIWYHLPALAAALLLLLTDMHPELRISRILPWVASLVVLCTVFTPASGIVIPGLKDQADHLRQQIMDRLFYTEPRDVFSLMTEGYYPQGSGQLGGKASPHNSPVLQVSTSRLTYLRGIALNEYDGRCWRNTLGGRRYLWDSPSSRQNRQKLFNQNFPAESLNASLLNPASVSIRMLSSGTSTLFVPQRIQSLRVGGELVPYFSNSSELFITRNLQQGDTWSVSAPLFISGDAGLSILVDSASSSEDPFWEEILDTYTTLPSHLEEPVWEIALDVTLPHETAYEKAFALQTFLSRSYRYTLDADEQPANIDFVTNFLFNTGKGYCTYFASAMTVLCRMAGLPARYIEGYLAEPNAQGEAVVTGLNGHAWTEVYFKGFGWVTFDATPRTTSAVRDESSGNSFTADSTSSPPPAGFKSETPTPEPDHTDPEETASPQNTSENESGSSVRSASSMPWLFFILLLVILILAILLRWHLTSPIHQEKTAAESSAVFDIWLREVSIRLNARKLIRRAGETPMSYTRRLDASENLPTEIASLGECVSLLKYSQAVPEKTDLQLVRDVAMALRRDQSVSVRCRYILSRLLPKKKKPFL